MKVSVDPYAGFCFGVKNAITMAEQSLGLKQKLYSLEEIVHNQEEVSRLKNEGLATINHQEFIESRNLNILFRAHGEPPSVYKTAHKKKHSILDATCPVVLKLQMKVRKAYEEMKNVNGQVVIFGRKSHPEVIGLNGHTNNTAIIVEKKEDHSRLDANKPIRLFAQTTKSKEDYENLIASIEEKIKDSVSPSASFKYYNTVCGQVTKRIPYLKTLSHENDIVVFVSGRNSSNGKYLYTICKNINSNSYQISSVGDIEKDWFMNANSVGISGATSTPIWLLEEIAHTIMQF